MWLEFWFFFFPLFLDWLPNYALLFTHSQKKRWIHTFSNNIEHQVKCHLALSRIWTLVANSISYNDKCYAKNTSYMFPHVTKLCQIRLFNFVFVLIFLNLSYVKIFLFIVQFFFPNNINTLCGRALFLLFNYACLLEKVNLGIQEVCC